MGILKSIAEQEVVDHTTGEVIKTTTVKEYREKVKSTDKFYMTFISPLYQVKSDSAKNLLRWMCCHAEYNTGRVILSAGVRDKICTELQVKNNTITNNLAILKKAKLISGSRGEFYINTSIFWKGDIDTREKLMQDKDFVVKFGFEN